MRSKVDDPVGGLDDFEIVLDDDDRIALIDQFVQHFKQLRHVVEMQAGCRLIENIERTAGRLARQFLGELDALRFAAGQGIGLLADLDIAEADLGQRLQLVAYCRDGGEELRTFLDGHIEHVGDRLALEQHLQRLAIVALAMAHIAGDINVGQEVHLDLDHAVALAFFAAPALDVEARTAPGS